MAAGQAGELAMSADANTPLAIFTVHAELPLKALQGPRRRAFDDCAGTAQRRNNTPTAKGHATANTSIPQ